MLTADESSKGYSRARFAGTRLLSRSHISSLLPFEAYLQAVEEAFRLHADGRALRSGMININADDGEFHIKAGGLKLNNYFVAVKTNGSFFQNSERFGMPTIQGTILLCDAGNGFPLAILDSREITIMRTGAAAALAAKHLARNDSSIATICGCGAQGHIQLKAMKSVLPIQKAYAFDVNKSRAEVFATEISAVLDLEVVAVDDLRKPLRHTDVCVTCTPSRHYFLLKEQICPGTFIAAMGADSADKQELDPELLRSNKVIVDLLDQCAQVGELHHAIERGMNKDDVYADLGAIITGRKPGRTSREEIIIFDATGTALQDVAAAIAIYEKALLDGIGESFQFDK